MSRTVAERRFQRRAITSVSRGPRNFSSAFSGLRRRRRSGRVTPRLSRAAAAHGDPPAPEKPRVPIEEPFATVRQGDVELDDEVPIARLIERTARTLAPFHDSGERERRKLALRVALLDAGPERRALRGVLAQAEGVKEAEPAGIGDPVEGSRGTFVLLVAGTLEQRGIAREEVQVPVFDGHTATAQTRPTTLLS